MFQPGALSLAQTGTRAHQLRLRAAKAKLHGMNFDGITRDEADRLHPLADFGGIGCIMYEPEGGSRTLMSLRPETRDGSGPRDYSPEYRPQEGGLARLVRPDKPFLDRDAAAPRHAECPPGNAASSSRSRPTRPTPPEARRSSGTERAAAASPPAPMPDRSEHPSPRPS